MQKINGKFVGKSIVSIDQFTGDDIEILFTEADRIKRVLLSGKTLDNQKGRLIANLFYESSTRTSSSFSVAMQRLGGGVVAINDVQYSSVSKGENLADTVRTLEQYVDLIVLRHHQHGATKQAVAYCKRAPVINAGDGVGEHPTQALLDLYTIRRKFSSLDGLRVAMVGDLKHGRTVHSLARLLARHKITFTYVAPEGYGMPPRLTAHIAKAGCQQHQVADLQSCITTQDVIYVTRVQEERLSQTVDINKLQDAYRVTVALMQQLPSSAILIHPLPRVGEIDMAVDSDPRAVYFDQVQHGLYLRMALLNLVLGERQV